ncbi:MAG: DUF2851 family protein [Bacteroidales bacterium]|nr:DUF2851 family protein [Bacteroidales bacterium]
MEALMQYVWQYRLWPNSDMRTVDGRKIEVLDPGILNRDAGPDFFNAKVQIGGESWAGDIEIHVRASDWKRHGHDHDLAYDSVVLHVVERDDAEVRRSNGEVIPQMVMTCAPDFSQRYQEMVNNPVRELPCGNEIGALNPLYLTDTFTALAFERLYEKAERVLDMVSRHHGNWTEAIYVTLARALGFNINSEPFQLLALTTPLKHLLRHSDSLLSIEAMLFGQAGLLQGLENSPEHYLQRLCEEYRFMASKFKLTPSQNLMWKMARTRPQNSPHRRIATLAAFVAKSFPMASRILAVESEEEARKLFDMDLQGFWARHYNFSPTPSGAVKALSQSSITVLIINVVVPVLYAYAQATGDDKRQEKAVELLQSLKPENNGIVQIYQRAGIPVNDAFTSQALIQLRKEYCLPRKCLFCRIGHRLLSAKVKR